MMKTFYWFDFETLGTDPARHWPVQFAGVRTDADFNEIGEPLEIFAKVPDDQLPDPEACLITGLTPDRVEDSGLCEADFIGRINQELMEPGTCALGYNTLRFDDEIIRHSLYRNFMDPYAREWMGGNSRWDLIDIVRLCAALRPEGINWPRNEEGHITFRLERLTQENNIFHGQAHDALADVRATIELARLVRKAQPRLFNFILEHKQRARVSELLDIKARKPVLHISGMYPAEKYCAALVVPIAPHPVNKNGVVVYDLSVDPQPLLTLDAEGIAERLFTPSVVLKEKGLSRVALKTVHVNRCPVIVPMQTLKDEDKARLKLDMDKCRAHYDQLFSGAEITEKVSSVFELSGSERHLSSDPDCMLYSGGFFSRSDRTKIDRVHSTPPEHLSSLVINFEDTRLEEMLFRYRARNWPQLLGKDELKKWNTYRYHKLFQTIGENDRNMVEHFFASVDRLLADATPENARLLGELKRYGERITDQLTAEVQPG